MSGTLNTWHKNSSLQEGKKKEKEKKKEQLQVQKNLSSIFMWKRPDTVEVCLQLDIILRWDEYYFFFFIIFSPALSLFRGCCWYARAENFHLYWFIKGTWWSKSLFVCTYVQTGYMYIYKPGIGNRISAESRKGGIYKTKRERERKLCW